MSEKLPINPDVLKWARKTSGLQLTDVARKMGKNTEVISSWESGELSPTYIQLEKLAYQVYKRPVALFFFPEPPVEETPGQAFRTLPDHEIENLSPRMHTLIKQAFTMQINLGELNDFANPAKKNILKDLEFRPDVSVETMAAGVREYLGITLDVQFKWKGLETALKEWRNALEAHGVFVFKESFKDENISGFCLHDDDFPVIYLNNSNAKSRQIFSIFHELAHLLLGTGGIDMRSDDFISHLTGDDKKIEVLCNRFAGVFLVPDKNLSIH